MQALRRLSLAAALGGAALLASGAGAEPGAATWSVQVSGAGEPTRAAAPTARGALHPGHGGPGGAGSEEASLDARYGLALGGATRVSLRYRGTLAREGAPVPRDRQRHAPELRLRQRLAEGWTARLGLGATAEWREGEGEALSLRDRGFAELDVEVGERLGTLRLRYEHRRAERRRASARQRMALRHLPPPLRLGPGATVALRPRLALERAAEGGFAETERVAAGLAALLETRAGPRLRTQLRYARRTREEAGTGPRLRESVLAAATRLALPLRPGLRVELELGWRGVAAERPGRSGSALRAGAGLELTF